MGSSGGFLVLSLWTEVLMGLPHFVSHRAVVLLLAAFLVWCTGCTSARATPEPWRLVEPWVAERQIGFTPQEPARPNPLQTLLPPTRSPEEPYATPTPDLFRSSPSIRTETITHVVRYGESLGWISAKYGIAISYISSTNNLANPDLLSIGQVLTIPAPRLRSPGPNFKILPNSELVYGPSSAIFDIRDLAEDWDGVFGSYVEDVEGRVLSAIEIVELVSQRYSINPRLLIALLEFQGSWLTQTVIPPEDLMYPLGYGVGGWEGLFNQLSWAADSLNAGYYLWRSGWLGPYSFGDGSVIIPGPGVNAGTVAVQHLFSQIYPVERWREVVGESGFYEVWVRLFGNPFNLAVEPLLPPDIHQPSMQLPFEEGKSWSFTSGPHSAWGYMAGWAALDFAPPGFAFGCVLSNEWVVAAADGLVLRADQGEVVMDLDQDGLEQTGWVLLYMHIEERDRVPEGTFLHAGERIGHPSCEGGFTTGTHLHLARKYNGEWIPADGSVPFEMDGWISSGFGNQYDGVLTKGNSTVEACACRNEWNQISR